MTKENSYGGERLPQAGPDSERFLAFFDALQDSFDRAAAGLGKATDRYFCIAGHLIRMRFAGSGLLASLTPALDHLAVAPAGDIALTVCLFDSAGSNERPPPPPWSWADIIARGDIRSPGTNRIAAAFPPGPGILSLFDSGRRQAIYWIENARSLPFHEKATPLRTILHWFMAGNNKQLVHAAAVGDATGGVLIAGRGGSGKSTAALACLTQGMAFAGDDCLLAEQGPQPQIHGLYGTAMLEPGQVARFPRLQPAVRIADPGSRKKLMLLLQPVFPRQISSGFPLRAILLPRVTGRTRTRLKKVSPADVFAAIAPSTIAVLPGAGERDFRYIGALIKTVPNFAIETGTDMADIGRTVARFLQGN